MLQAERLLATARAAQHPGQPFASFPASALPGVRLRDSLPAGYIPTAVATGDFNGDGKMDFVVANGGDNTLWLYFGKGDGTFNLPVILPIMQGQSPVRIATADLRSIGRVDLVVAEEGSNSIGVFLGNGDGAFAESSIALGATPTSLMVGDFNHDGKPDVLASTYTNATSDLIVLPGLGNGQFGTAISTPAPSFIWLSSADLNGDGYADLLATSESSTATVQVYLNNRDATFSAGQVVAENPPLTDDVFLSNLLFDADGDGKTDALAADSWGILWVFHGNGDGTFDAVNFNTFGIGDVGLNSAVADANGDGHLDVIVSGLFVNGGPFGVNAGNQICVLEGDGKGNFGPAKVYRGDSSSYSLAIGDFNGDGHPDVVTANQDNDSVSVFINDGLGGYGVPDGNWVGFGTDGAVNAPLTGAVSADLDGDGSRDVAFIEWNRTDGNYFQLTVLLNDGKGNLSAPVRSDAVLASASPGDFTFADFRNTGHLDFLSISESYTGTGSYISFAVNTGGGHFGPPQITTPTNASGMIGVGDFNRDGKLDFAAAGQCPIDPNNPLCIQTFLGNGDGTFRTGSAQTFGGTSPNARVPVAVYVGDFNQDGKLDLLILLDYNGGWITDDDVYEFFGNGDGTFQPAKLLFPHFGPMTVADVNGDGRPDIINMLFPIAVDGTAQPVQFSIYLGQPDGSFVLSNTYAPYGYRGVLPEAPQAQRGSGYYAPVVGDFNGDGKLDIAAVQESGTLNLDTFVQFLLGNGEGTFTPTYDIFDFRKPVLAMYAANLGSPTRTDLFELDSYRSSYVVLPSVVAPSFQFSLIDDPVPGTQGSAIALLDVPSTSSSTISLSASDPAIIVPTSITIPAGQVSKTFNFTIASGFNANHVFSVTATMGTTSAIAYGTVATGAGFQGGAGGVLSWPNVNLGAGQTLNNLLVSASSVNGYSTTVSFQCLGLTNVAQCQFNPPTIPVRSNDMTRSQWILSVNPAAAQRSYPARVRINDGILTQDVAFTLNVGDFTLSIDSPSVQLFPTDSGGTTFTLGSSNHFDQVVNLSCGGLSAGASCLVLPTGVPQVSRNQMSVSLQTQSVPVGNYQYTITGTSIPLTHTASAQLQVWDFGASVSPTSITAKAGGSANVTVTLTSSNGFNGSVNLLCQTPTAMIACSFSPASPVVPAGGTVNSAVTLTASAEMRSIVQQRLGVMYAATAVLVPFGMVILCGTSSRRNRLSALALVLMTALFLSCGGGSSGWGGGGGGGGTTYSIGVNATVGNTTHNAGTIKLTVN